ncbi:sugar transferase [soil metagenome]
MSIASQRETWLRTAARSRALRYQPVTIFALDVLVICSSLAVGAWGRQRWGLFLTEVDVTESAWIAGPAVAIAWVLVILMAGGYTRSRFDAGTEEFRVVSQATFATAGLVGIGCYLLDFPLSRGFFFIAFVVGGPALILSRLALRRLVHSVREFDLLQHNVLLVGEPHGVEEVARVLAREKKLGYRVVGCLTPDGDLDQDLTTGVPVLGRCEDVIWQVLSSGVEVVFFVEGGLGSSAQMRRIAWDLEAHDVQVVVAPAISEVSGDRVRIRPVGGLPLIHVDPPRALDAARWGKRLLDVVGSALLLLAASPVLAFAAVRITVHDRGPVLFWQTRVGRNGREFALVKLRTMVVDAEEQLPGLHAEAGYSDGLFKLAEDPRITRPGTWLRRLSLDELPQLFNVLRGDMSLVGPRPPLPDEVARYHGDMSRRLHVRPGLTGLWQVSGRSDLAWDEAIRLDLFYVDNWSMIRDLSILLRTVRAVVRPDGAY